MLLSQQHDHVQQARIFTHYEAAGGHVVLGLKEGLGAVQWRRRRLGSACQHQLIVPACVAKVESGLRNLQAGRLQQALMPGSNTCRRWLLQRRRSNADHTGKQHALLGLRMETRWKHC